MPYNYVTVKASSDLFAPATRAFGDIAVIGKGAIGSEASTTARSFAYPSDAVTAYPKGTTELAADAAESDTTLSTPADFPADTVVTIGEGPNAEQRTVRSTAEGKDDHFTWTLDKPLAADHESGEQVVAQGLSDLAAAISTAFRQTPPPTRVWGVQVAHASPDWSDGLDVAKELAVQIVVLANTPLGQDPDTDHPVELLAKHVVEVSNTGGDGKERIGVAMLDQTLTAEEQVALNKGAIHDARMVLIAHKSAHDDVAAAVAGAVAGYEPHISLLLKPLSIEMTERFTVADIDTLAAGSVNWVTSPALLPGGGLYMGEGLTASPSGNKKYIDIVRTLDDVGFRVKASLIEAIGDLRIDRPGLRTVVTLVQTVLSPLVNQGVIESYSLHIPLLVLLERDRATLTPDEVKLIANTRSSRAVDMEVSVVYAGVIHQITVKLSLKG
ncbi:hypothetical protein ACIQUL_01450 [Streptomyces sp. NPDC090303]|uniref:hypothetical protein n=1 Tax=Streptomyces sp. NPDC090303 TaxID=3365960 RepID=UPI0038212D54